MELRTSKAGPNGTLTLQSTYSGSEKAKPGKEESAAVAAPVQNTGAVTAEKKATGNTDNTAQGPVTGPETTSAVAASHTATTSDAASSTTAAATTTASTAGDTSASGATADSGTPKKKNSIFKKIKQGLKKI